MRFRGIALLLALAVAGCTPTDPSQPSVPANETFAASLGVDIPSMVKVSDDLYYKEITVGGGPVATTGKMVTVHYSGYTKDGIRFDTNVGSDSLRLLLVDQGDYISGWILGIQGMKAGGVRKLVIGSQLGYGSRQHGQIPANSTLVFDIYLKRVE